MEIVFGGEIGDVEGSVVVIEDGGIGGGSDNLREEVLEEAGKGNHWFSGVFSYKAKKKGVFGCRSTVFCSVYNRGIVVD